MGKHVHLKSLFKILVDSVVRKRFRSYQSNEFSLRRLRTVGSGAITLDYRGSQTTLELPAEEDTDGGLRLSFQDMEAFSTPFRLLTHAEKLHVAQNIRVAVSSESLPVQILDGFKPI